MDGMIQARPSTETSREQRNAPMKIMLQNNAWVRAYTAGEPFLVLILEI